MSVSNILTNISRISALRKKYINRAELFTHLPATLRCDKYITLDDVFDNKNQVKILEAVDFMDELLEYVFYTKNCSLMIYHPSVDDMERYHRSVFSDNTSLTLTNVCEDVHVVEGNLMKKDMKLFLDISTYSSANVKQLQKMTHPFHVPCKSGTGFFQYFILFGLLVYCVLIYLGFLSL